MNDTEIPDNPKYLDEYPKESMQYMGQSLMIYAQTHQDAYNAARSGRPTESSVAVAIREIGEKVFALEDFYPAEYPTTVEELDEIAPYTPIMVVSPNGKHLAGMKHDDGLFRLTTDMGPVSSLVLVSTLDEYDEAYIIVLPVPTRVIV